MTVKRRSDLTFRYNVHRGRHGWVRLTPAYSVKVVQEILIENPGVSRVLDPFSGTGTTGVVCGEAGISCDLIDINPFLVWLANVKTANYTSAQIDVARVAAEGIVREAKKLSSTSELWIPPISNVHRWWIPERLEVLARIYDRLSARLPEMAPVKALLLVAFCRLAIKWSNAAFNHQSMSFQSLDGGQQTFFDEGDGIYHSYITQVEEVLAGALWALPGNVSVRLGDSRQISSSAGGPYDCVITSPPYPNRMSYIRELRPYMYWLGYLTDARAAGELDWQAIGGTWGIATSRLKKWQPEEPMVDIPGLGAVVAGIAMHSPVLANYVYKYFADIATHLASLRHVLLPGAHLFYIVGNSKFYDVLVPVEIFYTELLRSSGFIEITVDVLRKRNSKKELFEFLVSARVPVS